MQVIAPECRAVSRDTKQEIFPEYCHIFGHLHQIMRFRPIVQLTLTLLGRTLRASLHTAGSNKARKQTYANEL